MCFAMQEEQYQAVCAVMAARAMYVQRSTQQPRISTQHKLLQ
jgi:hypothetical protein